MQCDICRKRITPNFAKDKNHWHVRGHCHFTGQYRGAAHGVFNLRFNDHNEIYVVFHNGSNYDYHFVMKILANEIKDKLKCLEENTEKYNTFLVLVEK